MPEWFNVIFINMNLQERIRKVLKEETEGIPKRTPLEKTVLSFVEMTAKDYKFPEDFYGFTVDIINNGKDCEITGLFKKSYKMSDSDKVHDILTKIKKEVSKYFGDAFYVRSGTSAMDSYKDNYVRYYQQRK
jgi:hypothetical protein